MDKKMLMIAVILAVIAYLVAKGTIDLGGIRNMIDRLSSPMALIVGIVLGWLAAKKLA